MTTQADLPDARVIGSRLGLREQVASIWTYRQLLMRMVRKELKVKYKNSFLGFFWSMLNPALYLFVFWLVFQVILQAGIPSFPIFLLSGLLAASRLKRTGSGSMLIPCHPLYFSKNRQLESSTPSSAPAQPTGQPAK